MGEACMRLLLFIVGICLLIGCGAFAALTVGEVFRDFPQGLRYLTILWATTKVCISLAGAAVGCLITILAFTE